MTYAVMGFIEEKLGPKFVENRSVEFAKSYEESGTTPDSSGKVSLNLAFGLVSSGCSCQTACWRPACCWLWWGSMSIGDHSKAIRVVVGFLKKISGTYLVDYAQCDQIGQFLKVLTTKVQVKVAKKDA